MSKGIIAFSGGLDSTVLLSEVVKNQNLTELHTIHFLYGAKNEPFEKIAIENILGLYRKCPIYHKTINVRSLLDTGTSKIVGQDKTVPEGHYRSLQMLDTVVPGRNLLFVSILASIAEAKNLNFIGIGLHEGAVNIYPDCSPEWYWEVRMTIQIQSRGKVELIAPLISLNKAEVIQLGLDNKVPFNLTRTCFTEHKIACGKCGSDQQRLAAFKELGKTDPVEYNTRELISL